MHMQAHMSGQVSGQVTNQAGPQLPVLPQHNGSTLSMQNLGSLRNRWQNVDPDLTSLRKIVIDRIFQIFQQRQTSHEWQQRVPELVRRLEEHLFRNATSKEEYMDPETLERRIQNLIRSSNNHNQPLSHLVSSSSSIGTMIPTPGMPYTGNTSSTVPSVDNSMIMSTPNSMNMRNLLPSANGSAGLAHGSLPNGYQSGLANMSIGSSGNNMISQMGVPRMTSQMIPTPGLNNSQSMPMTSAGSSGGGFSNVESMMVTQHQQQKQYIGGQNSRVLQNFSGQLGIGMRSSFQQKPSSYGFSNGTLNGGLPLIGNNMQLMNGSAASEGFMNTSSYNSSPKPSQQQFDHQRQQQLMQSEGYALNATDLSGSGNFYSGATSSGSAGNNQNLNSLGMQPKLKTNSALQSPQPNLQPLQQASHIKPQIVDNSPKMNFQASHLTRDHLLQSHQQMQKIQQQPYSQFAQHQQKQQNQQHQQLLMKNDTLRQHAQLASNLGDQIMPEHGTESHNGVLHAQVPEQYQLSDLQNQCQQNPTAEDQSKGSQLPCRSTFKELPQTSQHLQQMLPSNLQTSHSQNDFCSISAGSQSGTLMPGQWQPQPEEQPYMLDQSSLEQHVQKEFQQRISGQDEAQQPYLPAEGSMGGRGASVGDQASSCPPSGSGNTLRERQLYNQRRFLLFLHHARRCSAPEGKCQDSSCIQAKNLLKHLSYCSDSQCGQLRCHDAQILIKHYRCCHDRNCPVCVPVRQKLSQQRVHVQPPSDSCFTKMPNGTWRATDVVDHSRSRSKNATSSIEAPEDLQTSLKRVKMEHSSPSIVPKNEIYQVLAPSPNQTHDALPERLTQICQQAEVSKPARTEVMEVKMESSINSVRGTPAKSCEIKKDEPEDACTVKPDVDLIVPNEFVSPSNKQETMVVQKATDHIKGDIKQGVTATTADHAAGTKSGKPTIKGVSLTELFTPEQVREHIIGLRQWVGQSKAKAERNQAMEHSMSENSCQLCAVEKLTFEPPPIYCTPCGARIKRNAMYYTMGSGDTRHYFCIPCYNEVRNETIEVEGLAIPKARLEKKKNDEETEEWWVQCDKCEAWQHQICALFNGRRNEGGQAEYTCPNCYIEEIERGERKPLPQSAVLGAKDLPKTILSDHIEQRLFRRLRLERMERARLLGKNFNEVPGAEALVVRVVSSVDKKLEVKQRFLEIFQEENYPAEFPYKSKVVLLFQKIEGVEVCLFGMYVQEFGSECQFPNQRRVYLSYLDSVKYFRPEIKTFTGEALRTFVYHEILIGYLDYCKKRGFTSCYIWACPPLKGEDYILYCHPEIQKTPKSDKLREWYLAMLRKAAKENIVVDLTNLYDHFFISIGECKAKVTAARLPYFDGDYWPGAAEDMINQLQQEEDGRKQQKKGKTKKTITKRALKAAAQAENLSGNASKDALLMQKLGETICPMKEDFIMVHLQHACSHCCQLMVSGKRWVCRTCKNFQLCDKCHDMEQKLDERDKHPINSRDKHVFSPVEVNDVTSDTKDKDEILESEFFDTRQAFLSLCQGNHYQYDTLRRAKHSSMMVLYHLHNPTAPAFVTTCNTCHHDIETGHGWRCEICPDFDVCNACYQKPGGVNHPHKLTNHPSIAERDAQNKEARQKRVLQLRKMLDLLVHASQCRNPQCQYPNCRKVKGLFRHGIQCKIRLTGGCVLCKKMWYLLQLHARACKESECTVPRCRDLKDHLRRLQQQADSRRRAAVMEMMRQRAAEVAGNG